VTHGFTSLRDGRQNRCVVTAYMFAGLPVADYQVAYAWYVRLLGRAADTFPHDTEAVWRLTPTGAIYVVQDSERAGSGLLTVAVDDLDAHERRLREAGLAFAERATGHAPRRLVVKDVDGNTLTFFQDPGPPNA
jgi:glyoxylase I family protein